MFIRDIPIVLMGLPKRERDELEQARMTLAELGAFTGESSHGATKSVYGADPDGNEFCIAGG